MFKLCVTDEYGAGTIGQIIWRHDISEKIIDEKRHNNR